MTLQEFYEWSADAFYAAKSYAAVLTSRTTNVQRVLDYIIDAIGTGYFGHDVDDLKDYPLMLRANSSWAIQVGVPDGASVYVSVGDLLHALSEHLDRDGLDDDADHILIDCSYNGVAESATGSLDDILNQLASSVSGVQVIAAGLEVLANRGMASISDYVTGFQSMLQARFEASTDVIRAYSSQVLDIISDTYSDAAAKIVSLMSIITGGSATVTAESSNDALAEYTNASVWSAFSATVANWWEGVSVVVATGFGLITNIVNQLTAGALDVLRDSLMAMTGLQNVVQYSNRYEVAGYNDFVTRINMVLVGSSQLSDKLKANAGMFTYDTPVARIYLKAATADALYTDVLIQWKPINPPAFDRYIAPIKSDSFLNLSNYNLNPTLSDFSNDAETVVKQIREAAAESESAIIANNIQAWQGLWLSQYLLSVYIACYEAIFQGVSNWKNYFSNQGYVSLAAIFVGQKSYTDYQATADVGNYIMAQQARSWAAYYNFSSLDSAAQSKFSLLLRGPIVAASDLYWMAYSYSRRISFGRYTVMSDSNLAAIARNALAVTGATVVATAGFIAVRKLRKAAFAKESQAGQLGWNAFDPNTGALRDKGILAKAYKSQKASVLLSKMGSALGSTLSSLAGAVRNMLSSVTSAVSGGVKGLLTSNSSSVSVSDDDVTLSLIYHKIVG